MRGVRLRRLIRNCAAIAVPSVWLVAYATCAAVAQLPPVGTTTSTPTAAEMVSDVRIVGNETVPVAKIKPHIRTRPERPFDLELVEEDVRALNGTRMFVHVSPLYDRTPEGVVVIFQVRERPTIQYVRYVGNKKIKKRSLDKKVELKVGDTLDPFSVDEASRRILDLYHEKGFRKARIEIKEGSQLHDKGAVFEISEGPRQRIRWVSFEGNSIVSAGRLKTQIQSKPPIVWLIKGYFDEDRINGDLDRLTKYYRSLGYFRAKVGREIQFNDDEDWAHVTFVIDEGPRYTIRNVSFIGNSVLTEEQLRADMEVEAGQFFDQGKLNADLSRIQDEYGSRGYIYSDTTADPRFLEEPGMLDIVYVIDEGEMFRIGYVNVHIKGDNPHTRISVALNRISLLPGDIANIRKIRSSERRLKASQVFATNPQQGSPPRIAFAAPNLDGSQNDIAKRQRNNRSSAGQSQGSAPHNHSAHRPVIRGQSPNVGRTMPNPAPLVPSMPRVGTYPPATAYPPQQQVAPGVNRPPVTYPPVNSAVPVRPPARVAPWNVGQQPPPTNYAQQTVPRGIGSRFAAPPAATYPPAYPGPTYGYNQPPPAFGRQLAPQVQSMPRGGATASDELFPSGGYDYLDPTVDLDAYVEETQTGRLMFGVGVNSNAGVVGNIVLSEQNFDLFRPPRSWEDVRNGSAFRGAGQQFRIEAVPGTRLQRYMLNFREPYLFDTPVQLGVSAYLFNRRYLDWTEQRLGGRLTLGYQFAPDLSGSVFVRGERVNISNVAIPTPLDLAAAEGDSNLFLGGVTFSHNTRDNNFLPTEGHLLEVTLEQAFGTYEFARAGIDGRQHFLIRQRPDGSGRHVVSLLGRLGFTGSNTPIFENYFAGGFSTIRGFDFRGASPNELGVFVGGEFLMLGSIEYLFPLTANDMLRGVVFVDTGTVEKSIKFDSANYRISPGFGLRISVPALGPAPIAVDLAFPIANAETDDLRSFSFFVGFGR